MTHDMQELATAEMCRVNEMSGLEARFNSLAASATNMCQAIRSVQNHATERDLVNVALMTFMLEKRHEERAWATNAALQKQQEK
eukprot:4113460-Amphidinium_carterae.1